MAGPCGLPSSGSCRAAPYSATPPVTSRPHAGAISRRGLSDAEQHVRAVQAARRMISGGGRPRYRLEALPDGSWTVIGLPGITVAAASRRDAPDAARAAIAVVLEVPVEAFDVET